MRYFAVEKIFSIQLALSYFLRKCLFRNDFKRIRQVLHVIIDKTILVSKFDYSSQEKNEKKIDFHWNILPRATYCNITSNLFYELDNMSELST